MDGLISYILSKKLISKALMGISSIKLNADETQFIITCKDGSTFTVAVPQPKNGTITSDIKSCVNAGAIKTGDVVKSGKNLQQFAEQLLLDTLSPSVALTLTCSDGLPYNEFREKGTSINLDCEAIVTKKTYDISTVDWVDYISTSEPNVPVNGGTFTQSITNISDSIKIGVKAKDSEGNIGYAFKEIKFIDPVYMSLVDPSKDASNITASDLISTGIKILKDNSGFDVTVTTGGLKKASFSFPKSWGKLKGILDVANNFQLIGGYEETEVDITTIDGRTETYYVYIPVLESDVTDFVYKLTWV